jgi:hypothetical protein
MNNTTTPHNANGIIRFVESEIQKRIDKPVTKRKTITIERVMQQCENDEYEGICLACGEDAQGVEPDAREYECESCGKEKVFGCEELLFMIG